MNDIHWGKILIGLLVVLFIFVAIFGDAGGIIFFVLLGITIASIIGYAVYKNYDAKSKMKKQIEDEKINLITERENAISKYGEELINITYTSHRRFSLTTLNDKIKLEANQLLLQNKNIGTKNGDIVFSENEITFYAIYKIYGNDIGITSEDYIVLYPIDVILEGDKIKMKLKETKSGKGKLVEIKGFTETELDLVTKYYKFYNNIYKDKEQVRLEAERIKKEEENIRLQQEREKDQAREETERIRLIEEKKRREESARIKAEDEKQKAYAEQLRNEMAMRIKLENEARKRLEMEMAEKDKIKRECNYIISRLNMITAEYEDVMSRLIENRNKDNDFKKENLQEFLHNIIPNLKSKDLLTENNLDYKDFIKNFKIQITLEAELAFQMICKKEQEIPDIPQLCDDGDRSILISKKQSISSLKQNINNKIMIIKNEITNATISNYLQEFNSMLNDALRVEEYFKMIVELIETDEIFLLNIGVNFEASSSSLIIDCFLPNNQEISRVKEKRYLKTKNKYEDVVMSDKEFSKYYDDLIKRLALKIVKDCFYNDENVLLNTVIFNGWIKNIDKSTGNDFTACIISFSMNKADYDNINFSMIDPSECIKGLKGLTAGNMINQAPVKPIMQLNKEDRRFVSSKEVLENLTSDDNLASMDWFDFEQLVRELFSKYFSQNDSEVRVTQSSRDGGVDAIAFDTDPIRGGKYVIQAKRYNNVVPVSAVRDLYGTMINEGAVKGILVTTSHFGNDSREFAKDKPITLIDGANLVYMFNQYGYNVKIELQK